MSLYHLQIGLFVLLLLTELYLFALLFSSVDQQRFARLVLLGPFALLVPGVLSRRGVFALLGIGITTGCLLLLATGLFQGGELPGTPLP